MSYKQMTGNIISATKVEPDGKVINSAASGVWSLQEQYDYRRGGNWPSTDNPAARGLFMGGEPSSNNSINVIQYIQIATTSNATDFGDLSAAMNKGSATGSSTRSLNTGGAISGGESNVIEYVTSATLGNMTDFGDMSDNRYQHRSFASDTRSVVAGGVNNDIEYVTTASTGNVTDFGNLSGTLNRGAGFGSTTRGIIVDGASNKIEYVTIASTGNSTDFGDSAANKFHDTMEGCSNSTIGITSGYSQSDADIYKLTIASLGNMTDFGGNTTDARVNLFALASKARGVFAGGLNSSDNRVNTMDYITFASAGNASDFGDLTSGNYAASGTSNAHGGLA